MTSTVEPHKKAPALRAGERESGMESDSCPVRIDTNIGDSVSYFLLFGHDVAAIGMVGEGRIPALNQGIALAQG